MILFNSDLIAFLYVCKIPIIQICAPEILKLTKANAKPRKQLRIRNRNFKKRKNVQKHLSEIFRLHFVNTVKTDPH